MIDQIIEKFVLAFGMLVSGDFLVHQEVDKKTNRPIVDTCEMRRVYQVCIGNDRYVTDSKILKCKRLSYEYVADKAIVERKENRDNRPACYKSLDQSPYNSLK